MKTDWQAKRQVAVDAVANGSTHQEAADLAGVKLRTVYSWCHQEGVLVNPHASEEEIDDAMRLLLDGRSLNQTAKTTGYHRDTIKRWARARGIEYEALLRSVKHLITRLDNDAFRDIAADECKRRGMESL